MYGATIWASTPTPPPGGAGIYAEPQSGTVHIVFIPHPLAAHLAASGKHFSTCRVFKMLLPEGLH